MEDVPREPDPPRADMIENPADPFFSIRLRYYFKMLIKNKLKNRADGRSPFLLVRRFFIFSQFFNFVCRIEQYSKQNSTSDVFSFGIAFIGQRYHFFNQI